VEDFIISTSYDGKKRKLYRYKCIVCGRDNYAPAHVLHERKFCDQKCQGKYKRDRISIKCNLCGVEFERVRNKLRNSKSGYYFCSRKCKDTAQRIGNGFEVMQPSHYGSNLTDKAIFDRDRREYIKDKEIFGSCQICGLECKRVIDHNHIDGKIRGMLCSKCNWGLGFFRDDIEILKSAIQYLFDTRDD